MVIMRFISASSVIEYSLENEQFEEQYGKKYLDAWYEKISKPADRRIDSNLAKWAVIYSAKYKHADVLNWLLKVKHKDLTGYPEVVSHLIKYQNYDEAKQLLPEKGKNWRSRSSFSIEYDAELLQSINQMWVEWADDPWSCALVNSTLLKFYKNIEGANIIKDMNRIYQSTVTMDGVHYLNKELIFRKLYADLYYMNTDEEFLKAYLKTPTTEDLKQSGISKLSALDKKAVYRGILAKSAALRGDLSMLESFYETILNDNGADKYNIFFKSMNMFVAHLIVNDEGELLKKYNTLIKKISNARKERCLKNDSIIYHFIFTRLVYEMETHQELNYQRVFGDYYAEYKKRVDSIIRTTLYKNIFKNFQDSPVWMSSENEIVRRKMIRKFLKYSDLNINKKIWLSKEFKNCSVDKLVNIIPGSIEDLFALAEDRSLKLVERAYFDLIHFRYLLAKPELEKVETLYVRLRNYHVEKNPELHDRVAAAFFNLCQKLGRDDLVIILSSIAISYF